MKKYPVCYKHLPENAGAIRIENAEKCCKCDNPAQFVVLHGSLIDRLMEGGHTCTLNKKIYVLLSGLLKLAHENGLREIKTEIIEHDREQKYCMFRSVVSGERGTFTGHGAADPSNCNKMVAGAYIRMSETRSIVRALRWYLGICMTAKDELP